MKKTFSLLLFLVSATSFAFSQTSESGSTCQLSSAQMPAIRGIKLGMHINDLLQVLYDDTSSVNSNSLAANLKGYPEYGRYNLSFSPHSSTNIIPFLSKEKFPGIEDISVTFFDDRIISFTIRYTNFHRDKSAPVWNSVQELIGKFVKAYKLPESPSWFIESTDTAFLTCADFKAVLKADMVGGGLTFIDVRLLKDLAPTIKARREEDMQKRREAFKP